MSRSNDAGHFFQTTSALNESARKASKSQNTKGNPIKLPSKILAVLADPENASQIYIAEAAGNVKKINIETDDILSTFSGPTAPLTSLAVSPATSTLYAGSWDKSIWSWSLRTRKPALRFAAHTDFVKALLALRIHDTHLLVSGSADASIIVWDASTGEKLHTLKGHTRGVLHLALDPETYPPDADVNVVTVFSAGSDREIRRWSVGREAAGEIQGADGVPAPVVAHETSVFAACFDGAGDLWSASADKTARCLARARGFEADTELVHPDFVRGVVVDEVGGWVVTACRDEEVRVWEKGSGELHHLFEGHYEEVTGIVLLEGQRVVSVSIDGTVRRWSLKAAELAKAIKEAEDERAGKIQEVEAGEKQEGLMTVEEEAELAELMEDSD
ncbi:WD40 repeat-like protein [Polyplosphaeria fusca]|uniref:WD40 repeat-like protein n=1 Tax=Polyplosphaeria fusca TaxID=682080 RepID=A0A9P4R508_9PLEO|nr:WD40 repeat-like protein [Polyplosphaeria fusca]